MDALEDHLEFRTAQMRALEARVTDVENRMRWYEMQVRIQQRAQHEGSADASNGERA